VSADADRYQMVFRYTHTLRVRLDESLILIKLSRTGWRRAAAAAVGEGVTRLPTQTPVVWRRSSAPQAARITLLSFRSRTQPCAGDAGL